MKQPKAALRLISMLLGLGVGMVFSKPVIGFGLGALLGAVLIALTTKTPE